ncbi:MAG: hypothetical protein Q7T51_01150 [Candidatus Moranbacteria bacterium]|nr:hypothetical protein [Candidatus Moranbacteria bacterium]
MQSNTTTQFLSDWKTEIISSVVVLICIILLVFFPVQGVLQDFSKYLLFLFILPALYIKLVLKKDLRDFGLNLQNPRLGLVWAAMMLVVSVLSVSILFQFFDFANKYTIPAYLGTYFWAFLLNELVLVALLLFINDFFFKGFVLFTLAKKFSLASAIIQALVFVLFTLSTGSLDWHLAPTIILAFTGGIATYKSRSFVYSFLMSLIFMTFLDAYIIHIFK